MFRVIIELEARNNIRAHYLRLQSRLPDSDFPARWYYGFRTAIRDLATSAEQCGVAYEDRFFAETIRQKLVGSYKVLFTIHGEQVHVLHIRHRAQDPEDLFR